jgi:hypothetical protein
VEKDGGVLRVVWAKPFSGNEEVRKDFYKKTEGIKICKEKLEKLKTISSICVDKSKEELNKALFENLPACVASTLPWYVSSAKRYFRIQEPNFPVNVWVHDTTTSIIVNIQNLIELTKPIKKLSYEDYLDNLVNEVLCAYEIPVTPHNNLLLDKTLAKMRTEYGDKPSATL